MNDTTAPKIDTTTLLADIKKKANKADALEVPAVEVPVAPVVELPNVDSTDIAQVSKDLETVQANLPVAEGVAEYQQYTSSRVSTTLITPSGKRIRFSNYQYYTVDSDIINYLDKEIAAGLKGFIKGKLLTSAELDPEAAKKREIIEEFKASQEGRDFGNTKPKSERTTALSSDQVAN